MRAVAYLAAGLVVFVALALAITPSDARAVVLPAVAVAAVIMVAFLGAVLGRRLRGGEDVEATDRGER